VLVAVITAVTAVIVAIIGAWATIAAARIKADAKKQDDTDSHLLPLALYLLSHRDDDENDDDEKTEEHSGIVRILHGIATVACFLIMLAGSMCLMLIGFIWLGAHESINVPNKNPITAFLAVAAILLLGIARWIGKRLD
jgi:hypothetical protein